MSNYSPPYKITSKMINLISSISEEVTRMEYYGKEIITPRLRKKNRVKTIAGTLEIEGNFIGEDKITAILDGKRVLGTYQEILEVEGAIGAYSQFENYKFDSLDDLLKAHKLLMKDILKSAGTFRNINVGVGNEKEVSHIAPPFSVVPQLMQQLFQWLKESQEHPLIKSCVFHYEFEFIHPFSDGNGRIGRLWQSVILYHWKEIFSSIPTESIIRDNQDRYYKALEKSGEIAESTPFIEFMLEAILIAIQSSVKSSVKSSVNTEDKIINYIKENPQITIKELSQLLNLTIRAIEKQMSNLKKEKKIARVGSRKKGYWKVIDEL